MDSEANKKLVNNKRLQRIIMVIIIIILLLLTSCTSWNLGRMSNACDEQDKGVKNTVDDHLENANEAQTKLEQLLAAQAAGEDVDENLIEQLISEIVTETEAAIESAEENTDPAALQEMLDQINQLQEESLETFNEALDVIEGEGATETVTDAITTTTEEQGQVTDAIEETGTALESGTGTVEVDIGTTGDQPSDGTTEPPADGTTEPPADGTTEPPADGTIAPTDTTITTDTTTKELPPTAASQAQENAEDEPGSNK